MPTVKALPPARLRTSTKACSASSTGCALSPSTLDAPNTILVARRQISVSRYDKTAATLAGRATDLGTVRASLERALRDLESANLRVTLGRIALRQGDRGAALANAARALELEPSLGD